MSKLRDKVAVITGASAGIGRATALLFRRQGARVVLNARRQDRLEGLAKETEGTAVAGDITDAAVRARILEACGGRIDILVNNAGYGEPGPVETVPEDDYRRQFEVNFFAPAAMIQAVLPMMRKQRSGHIVNISSVAGRFGYPLFGWYCATKHALEGLTDALRVEVQPWGVHAVLVEPGPVKTEFFDVTKGLAAPQVTDTDSPYSGFFAHMDEIESDFMKGAATSEDVAAVVLKACTHRKPKARYAVAFMAKSTIAAAKLLPRSWLDAATRKQFRVPRPEDLR